MYRTATESGRHCRFFGLSFPRAARKMWGGVRILPAKEIHTQGQQSKMRLHIKCMRNLLEDI